jgi:hypothetical protein
MKRAKWVLLMAVLAAGLLVVGCGSNSLEFLADDTSEEACRYDVTRALDEQDYEEVLEADCAESMDRGAAYLGLAGFDVNDIITDMSDANDLGSDADQTELYLNSLVGDVNGTTMTYLDAAIAEYDSYSTVSTSATSASSMRIDDIALTALGTSADLEADSQFYANVIARPMFGLASLKGLLDPDGDGRLSSCDINDNGSPDEADALACGLLTSASVACTSVGASAGPQNTLTFPGYSDVSFGGYEIDITSVAPDSSCPSSYKGLLATNPSTTALFSAVTTADICAGSDGQSWLCPYLRSGQPVDVVAVLQEILNTAVDYLASIITTIDDSEIYEAVDELRSDMCGVDSVCTAQEIAAYAQTLRVSR